MSLRLANSAGPGSKMLLSEFIEYFLDLSKHDLRSTTLDRVYRPSFKSLLAIWHALARVLQIAVAKIHGSH